MKQGAHTPGPWTAEEVAGVGFGPGTPVIASSRPGSHLAWITRGQGPEGSANACLIAAAPDLLEALKALTEEVCDYTIINNLGDPEQKHNVRLALAAIAKATGA